MEIHRKLNVNEELAFFEQYEGVVFGVLKRLHIQQTHRDYDDFAQIGRLKLVEAYESYADDPWDEPTRGAFVSFAFTRIRWGIIDAIRKCAKQEAIEQQWDETLEHSLPNLDLQTDERLFEEEWLAEVLKPLTQKEQRLVIDLCIYRETITAVAEKESVSRKTIYQRRKRVKEKLLETIYQEKGASDENTHY